MAQSYGSLRTNAGLYGAGNDAETIAFNQRLIEQDMQANPWKYDGSSYQRQAQEIARGNQFVMDLNTQPGGGASWGGAASSQGLGRFSSGQQTPQQWLANPGTWYADPASAQWSNTQVRPMEGGQSGKRAGADSPSLRLPGNTGTMRTSTAPTNPDGSPQQQGTPTMAQPYQNPTYTSPTGVPYGMTAKLSPGGEPLYPHGVQPPANARALAGQYAVPAGMGNPYTPGANAPSWGTPGRNTNAGLTTSATTPSNGLAMYGAGHTSYGQGNNATYTPAGSVGANGEWVDASSGNRPVQGQGVQPSGYSGYNFTAAPPPRPTYGDASGGSGMWSSGTGTQSGGSMTGGSTTTGTRSPTDQQYGFNGMPQYGAPPTPGGTSVGIGRQTGVTPTVFGQYQPQAPTTPVSSQTALTRSSLTGPTSSSTNVNVTRQPTQTYVNGQQYSMGGVQGTSLSQAAPQQAMTRDMVTGNMVPQGTATDPRSMSRLTGTTSSGYNQPGYSDYKGPPQGSLAYLAADAAKHPNSVQAQSYGTIGTGYQQNWSPLDIQNMANTNRLRR